MTLYVRCQWANVVWERTQRFLVQRLNTPLRHHRLQKHLSQAHGWAATALSHLGLLHPSLYRPHSPNGACPRLFDHNLIFKLPTQNSKFCISATSLCYVTVTNLTQGQGVSNTHVCWRAAGWSTLHRHQKEKLSKHPKAECVCSSLLFDIQLKPLLFLKHFSRKLYCKSNKLMK